MIATISRWLTNQYVAYCAIPIPIQVGIERGIHFIGLFALGMGGAIAMGVPWKQALLAGFLPAGGGQYTLNRQLPRDPTNYPPRTNNRAVEEDQLH